MSLVVPQHVGASQIRDRTCVSCISRRILYHSATRKASSILLANFCCSVLSRVQLFVNPWPAGRQASLSFTTFWSLLKLMSTESVMPSNHLILCRPFSSCLQSFLASGSLPMSWFFASGGQSIGGSASVLPMNIQGWFPLGLTRLISLLSKGLSRVFSSTAVWKCPFFGAHSAPFIVTVKYWLYSCDRNLRGGSLPERENSFRSKILLCQSKNKKKEKWWAPCEWIEVVKF